DSRLQAPQEHLDDILKASEFWLSVAVFMNDLRWESVRKLVTAIGLRQVGLPLFDLEWAELLLNGLLFDNRCQVTGMEKKIHHLHQRLHNIGAVDRRRVRLRGQKRNLRLLQSGQGMLRAISDIVELEGRMQQQRMRLVILTDHIRESALPSPQDTDRPFEKLGVVPIFETLRRLQLPNLRLCILTGSIVVIPRDCESFLREDAASHHIPFERFRLEELWHAPEFLRVKFTGSEGSKSVELITAIFARGLLNTIVGTASLLGEGWDAPSVNTLIMASAVAAHVSSNQMRGRAIRSLKSNPFKVANIWHLACVAPHADEQDRRDWFISANCGEESMASTRIRFRAFVGLSLEQPLIESGIERLGEQQCPPSSAGIDAWNARMVHHASRRDELAGRWKEALGPPSPGRSRLVRELRLDTGYLHSIFRINPREHGSGGIWQSLFYRWFIWRSRRRLVKIALATAEALATLKIITPGSIPVVESSEGRLFQVTLPAANHLDQTRFVEALAELFTPLNSPRYLLLRHHRYYAVPTNCGEKKPRALLYAAAWLRRVGKAKLIFTQNRAGRLHLLKAKEQALATYFNYSLDTRMRWLNTPNQ
ncbi:MAG: hypothetical protein GY731_14530, partial [Gammaproteobacteria bacterium]|nr:hypothetical protein [Gammaproteobacteria bacterium]